MYQNRNAHDWVVHESIGNEHWIGREKLLPLMLLALMAGALHPMVAAAATLSTPSHSTTIALTSNDRFLVVVNREANSISLLRVRNALGYDVQVKIAEIPVGLEPRCVVISPDDRWAYVTNAISGTVSIVSLEQYRVLQTIKVGTEPRGCALTPNGAWLYVANHTQGTVSIISTAFRSVIGTVSVGRHPMAIAVTNDGDSDDLDERVFVTQIFAELILNGPGEGRDVGKQGVVQTFPVANPNLVSRITLAPLADSGFTSDRTKFCPHIPGNEGIHPPDKTNPIFCPDPGATVANDTIKKNPQGVFPNQLLSAVIRGNRLWLPNIGAQPEPVERFDTNVQALVYAVDTSSLTEVHDEAVNLNAQIATESVPANPTHSLDHLFGNDIVAIDAGRGGKRFLIVSRGGNYVLRAGLDADGKLDIHAPDDAVRFQTGNLPSGVVMTKTDGGRRAYANNEANFSVTAMDLDTNTVLARDIPSSEPPAPGSLEHSVMLGKVAFFTALGIPDNGIFGTPLRQIVPLHFRGKQSKEAWSSCGSCHPDGLADGVTWFFGTGPRQTKPLDGMFAKDNPSDQALLNWSAVRGSNTDFNNNSRATQGGCGFASDITDPGNCIAKGNTAAANLAIYDHGITMGGSDALDVQTLWIFAAVRPLLQPKPSDTAALSRGRAIFATYCATCHGGAKWTKSQIFHRDNPAAVSQNGAPLDPGVVNNANEFRSFTCNSLTFDYLEHVGTFNVNNPKEIRDLTGITALGADGFSPPSLLSVRYHAPYLHRGQAQTLAQVLPLHKLPTSGKSITDTLAAAGKSAADLLVFLKSIDGRTNHLRSEGDDFRDALRLQGTCPAQTTSTQVTRVPRLRPTTQ
ncbi:MAG TPA: beta-propeller fold lactonase family protein [Bryobacteraceae bacterium]